MKILKKLAETEFVRTAIEERADLSEFKKRPSLRTILGVSSIGISYIICWPLISFLAAVSIYMHQPWIIVIGGPVAYGLSHLVFLFGMYLAGAYYSKVFLKWAARITLERIVKTTS